MKQFLLFAGDIFGPQGGWNDFRKDFYSLGEVERYIEDHISLANGYKWAQIVDSSKGTVTKKEI